MLLSLLSTIRSKYKLVEIDCDKFAVVSNASVNYTIRQYAIEDFGHLCTVTLSRRSGKPKQEFLLMTPYNIDAPILLIGYRSQLSGYHLTVEYFNTLLRNSVAFDNGMRTAQRIGKTFEIAVPYTQDKYWYDSIRLYPSIAVKSPKRGLEELVTVVSRYLEAYCSMCAAVPSCSPEDKIRIYLPYINSLLRNKVSGADIFTKILGEEATDYLFKHIIFGI